MMVSSSLWFHCAATAQESNTLLNAGSSSTASNRETSVSAEAEEGKERS